jgi:hypothetical protein
MAPRINRKAGPKIGKREPKITAGKAISLKLGIWVA